VDVQAPRDGVLAGCDCFALGEAVVAMGGGRRAKEDDVDPRVGVTLLRERGTSLKRGEAFARVHLAREDAGLVRRVLECFSVDDRAPEPLPQDLVLERV